MEKSSDNSSIDPLMDENYTSICKLEIQGDISGQRVIKLENEFAEVITSDRYKKVSLNLSSAHNIDSQGIALCVGLFKECKIKNIEFEIIANNDILRIFRLINLDRILPIKESY